LGVIAANPNEGYAAVRVIPRLPVQYSQSVVVSGLKLDIVLLSGLNSQDGEVFGGSEGDGLVFGGDGMMGGIRNVNATIETIGEYKNNFIFKASDHENLNCEVHIINNNSSVDGAVLVTVEHNSGFNHRIKSSVFTTGTGAIINGYDSMYEFYVSGSAPNKAFIINASRNLIIASGLADSIGWSDRGNHNKIISARAEGESRITEPEQVDADNGESQNRLRLYYFLGIGGLILVGVIFFEYRRRRSQLSNNTKGQDI